MSIVRNIYKIEPNKKVNIHGQAKVNHVDKQNNRKKEWTFNRIVVVMKMMVMMIVSHQLYVHAQNNNKKKTIIIISITKVNKLHYPIYVSMSHESKTSVNKSIH